MSSVTSIHLLRRVLDSGSGWGQELPIVLTVQSLRNPDVAATLQEFQVMILKETLPVDLAAAAVEEAVRVWHKAGNTPGKAAAGSLQDCVGPLTQHRDVVPVRDYFGQFARESCKAPIAFIAGALLSNLVRVPFVVHAHEPLVDPSARADHESWCESASSLPSEVMTHGFPAIVKTVTMVVRAQQCKHFLSVTSLGDVAVDDYTLHSISELTGLSRTVLKHHSHINTPEFDPLCLPRHERDLERWALFRRRL